MSASNTLRQTPLAVLIGSLVSGVALPASAQVAGATEAAPTITVISSARKREEQQIDVPMAQTVISGAQLEAEGVKNSGELMGRVPSLSLSQNNVTSPARDQTFIVMRGVGANPVLEPSVGVFIDGVYVPSVGFDLGFLDVLRIEVLRGPQGTLFGRNTQGGAINIVTRKPSAAPKGRAQIAVGNDGESLFGTFGGALGAGGSAFSVALAETRNRGHYENATIGGRQDRDGATSARVALRLKGGPDTTIDFTYDLADKRGRGVGLGVPDARTDRSYKVYDDSSVRLTSEQIQLVG